MAQTLKEAQSILHPKPKRTLRNGSSGIKSELLKNGSKKKKITKSKTSKKVTSGKDKTSNSKAGKRNGTPKKPTKRTSLPSIPAVPSLPANFKKTAFKTKSRDHLPIPAFGFIDVCFCIDATGSMGSELAQAQSTIISIINNIGNKVQTEGLSLRFAVVSYRDHPPQESSYVTQALDFTDGHEASQYVEKLIATGGGDTP